MAALVQAPLYQGAQAAVVVGLAAAIDAGWSGDWSRIGAITGDDEAAVRATLPYVGAFHLVCAPVAYFAAASKGNDPVKATFKTLLIGGLACGEALFRPPGSQV